MTHRDASGPSFRFRVLSVVRRIPPGRVATYGDVAEWAGVPRAARAVGTIMATASGSDAPCHRVVASGGLLGGYGGHESLKRALLEAEGIQVTGRRLPAFKVVRWDGPAHSRTASGARGASRGRPSLEPDERARGAARPRSR